VFPQGNPKGRRGRGERKGVHGYGPTLIESGFWGVTYRESTTQTAEEEGEKNVSGNRPEKKNFSQMIWLKQIKGESRNRMRRVAQHLKRPTSSVSGIIFTGEREESAYYKKARRSLAKEGKGKGR